MSDKPWRSEGPANPPAKGQTRAPQSAQPSTPRPAAGWYIVFICTLLAKKSRQEGRLLLVQIIYTFRQSESQQDGIRPYPRTCREGAKITSKRGIVLGPPWFLCLPAASLCCVLN